MDDEDKYKLEDCAICFMPMEAGKSSNDERVSALCPCGHLFHTKCYMQWHNSQKSEPSCPNCRAPVTVAIILASRVPFIETTFVQERGQPPIDARTLVENRIRELNDQVARCASAQKTIEKLDKQIELAKSDKDAFQYVKMRMKVQRNVTLVQSYDVHQSSPNSAEMKFLTMMAESESKKYIELLNKKSEQNRVLETLSADTNQMIMNTGDIRNDIALLRRQCAEQGIDIKAIQNKINSTTTKPPSSSSSSRPLLTHSNLNRNNHAVLAGGTILPTVKIEGSKKNTKNTSHRKIVGASSPAKMSSSNHNQQPNKISGKIRQRSESAHPRRKNGKNGDDDDDEDEKPFNDAAIQNKNFMMMEYLEEEAKRQERTPLSVGGASTKKPSLVGGPDRDFLV